MPEILREILLEIFCLAAIDGGSTLRMLD